MTGAMTIHHVLPDLHIQRGRAGAGGDNRHAESARRMIVQPHDFRTLFGNLLR
jgi:hypothetical protein